MKRRAKFFFKNIDAQIGYFVPFFHTMVTWNFCGEYINKTFAMFGGFLINCGLKLLRDSIENLNYYCSKFIIYEI